MKTTRRDFIKNVSIGTVGIAAGSHILKSNVFGLGMQDELPNSKVALISGSERRQMAYDAIKIFENEIKTGIEGKQIILKPNCVSDSYPACATHPDSLRGLLDFFAEITDQNIQIAEASASEFGTISCYEDYQYLDLEEEYNVTLVDMNLGEWTELDGIQTINDGIVKIRIVNPFLDPDNYIVSVSRMKTHWHMVATLSVKNFLMGAPWNGQQPEFENPNQVEKVKMHGCDNILWEGSHNEYLTTNLPTLAVHIWPDFGFVDGFEGMEGNGPTQGTPVDHRISLAGPDCIAVDRIGMELMGINPHYMRYVKECADLGLGNFDCSKIDLVGELLEDHIIQYQWPYGMHDMDELIAWLGEETPSVCEYNHYETGIKRRAGKTLPHRKINVTLPHSMNTHTAIYNMKAQRVRQLTSHTLKPGKHSIPWDGLDDSGKPVAAGTYILQMRTGAGIVSQKITVP